MQGKPPAALGSGAYVAGVAGAAALVAGFAYDAAAPLAVGGLCLGIVAGGLAVTRSQLLGRGLTSRLTGAVLLALGAWVTWTGVQSGAGARYQLTIGSVFVAVVGWAVMVRGDGALASVDGTREPRATLPRTTDGATAGDGRRQQFQRLVDVGVIVAVAYFFYRALAQSDPSSWLFGGLFLVVFLPGTRSQVRLTDSGLVTTHYVFWRVPFDQSQTPWTGLYGYEATDTRLRIAADFGPDRVYDLARIDDVDRVVAVLDDHIPRL
ncbi:hypothetical protein NDI56_08770 [Haloarcula sp. S1CR25-12]|uniref:PH domain-containing protein n=1 Tax=Haloarcula saliterrae TaxID=2950534 RepID=A0ABU2FB31_9EURY|nr:hypothetical protein [Haloarcula sp. S1CR25-12]MDS0259484.1 hypothetical protein [Haloarcula sp. S1CR25-12]